MVETGKRAFKHRKLERRRGPPRRRPPRPGRCLQGSGFSLQNTPQTSKSITCGCNSTCSRCAHRLHSASSARWQCRSPHAPRIYTEAMVGLHKCSIVLAGLARLPWQAHPSRPSAGSPSPQPACRLSPQGSCCSAPYEETVTVVQQPVPKSYAPPLPPPPGYAPGYPPATPAYAMPSAPAYPAAGYTAAGYPPQSVPGYPAATYAVPQAYPPPGYPQQTTGGAS